MQYGNEALAMELLVIILLSSPVHAEEASIETIQRCTASNKRGSVQRRPKILEGLGSK